MKKVIAVIVLLFAVSTCAVVVVTSTPYLVYIGFAYFLLNPVKEENGKYKEEVLEYYEENKNIILPKEDINVEYIEKPVIGNTKYITTFKAKDKFKTKYMLPKDDERYSENIPEDIHQFGLKKYIINNLIYNQNKGNHFEKIEEYLQNNRQRIFNIFLSDEDKGVRIYFDLKIMYKLPNGEFYWDNQRMKINNHILKYSDEYGDENYVKNKEKGFFKEKVKYEDIDWAKYIEYMKVYPVLYMNVEYKDSKGYVDNVEIKKNSENVKKLLEIYKEIEKFYNKKTFNFVIR